MIGLAVSTQYRSVADRRTNRQHQYSNIALFISWNAVAWY